MTVDAQWQVSSIAGILIGAQIVRATEGVGHRSNARLRHHAADELDAFAMIVAREVCGNESLKSRFRILTKMTSELMSRGIAIVLTTRRIGSIRIDLRGFERERVHPGGVASAMLDEHRMSGTRSIKASQRQRA